MKKSLIGTVCLAFASSFAFAQQTNTLASRSITIEGVYNADVTDAQKVMPMPEKPEFATESGEPEYAADGVPYMDFTRDAMTAPDQPQGDQPVCDGLVKLGYGLHNDLDAAVNLRTVVGDNGLLSVTGGATGWNGELEHDWKSRFYDTDLKVSYRHNLDGLLLDVSADAGYGFANFKPSSPYTYVLSRDSRNVLRGGVEAGISCPSLSGLDYSARVGWDIFSQDNIAPSIVGRRGIENIFRLDGNVGGDLSESLHLNVSVSAKTLFYRHLETLSGAPYRGVTTISLKPVLSWKNTDVDLAAGADATFRSRFAPHLQFSPYLHAVYRAASRLSFSAEINGGTDSYEMRRLYSLSPYYAMTSQVRDGYTRLDASIGAVWNVIGPLELALRGGYASYSNHVFQTPSLGYDMMLSEMVQSDATVWYARLSGTFASTDLFSLHSYVECFSWKSKKPEQVLCMVPEVTGEIYAEGYITDRFLLRGGYRYSLMRKCDGNRLPSVNDLNVGMTYRITDNLDAELKGTNLLCSRHYRFAGYRAENASVLASLLLRF